MNCKNNLFRCVFIFLTKSIKRISWSDVVFGIYIPIILLVGYVFSISHSTKLLDEYYLFASKNKYYLPLVVLLFAYLRSLFPEKSNLQKKKETEVRKTQKYRKWPRIPPTKRN